MPVGSGWEVPNEIRDRVEFHWFHVPTNGALVLCILSAAPVWYVGHFEKGRMRQCLGKGCEMCSKGLGTQLRYVVSCIDISTRQVGVLEFGQSVAMLIKQWSTGFGYMRGMIIEISRAHKNKHSRMEVNLIKEHPPAFCLSTEPLDLEEVLERTWDRQQVS